MMGLAVGAEMDSLPQPVMNFSNATPSTFVEKRVYFPGAMNWGIMVTEEANASPTRTIRASMRATP